MAKLILICGKLCSGKTTYAKQLCRERRAVLLSVDELMLAMHDPYLGDRHDKIAARAREYLYDKAFAVIAAGVDVVLDWGFWTKQMRREAISRCAEENVAFEWHGVFPNDAVWHERIAKRNAGIMRGVETGYIVDDGLMAKFQNMFEMPERSEMKVWISC